MRCGQEEVEEKVIYSTTTARDSPTTYRPRISSTEASVCRPGSTDPRCNQVAPTFAPRFDTSHIHDHTRVPIVRVTTDGNSYQYPTTQPPRTRAPVVRVTTQGSYETTTLPPHTRRPIVRVTTEATPSTFTSRSRTNIIRGSTEGSTYEAASTLAPRTRIPVIRVTTDATYEAPTTYVPRERIPVIRTSTASPVTRTRGTRPPFVQTVTSDIDNTIPRETIPSLSQSSNTNTKTQVKPNPRLQCYPNSADPRCKTQTRSPNEYLPPVRPTEPTQAPFRCVPGSTDPRCPQPKTTTESPVRCYPGSTDPRCPQPTTTTPALFRCFPGSQDPRCP